MEANHSGKEITTFQLVQILLDITKRMQHMNDVVESLLEKPSKRLAEEWINSQQVMKILNISKVTLQTLRDKGTLPCATIRGKIYYNSDDVEALLKSNYKKRPPK